MEEKKLFLLDAYALIYRAYYALLRSPRTTSSGMNTSAIFGFCNTLDEILKKENPAYMASTLPTAALSATSSMPNTRPAATSSPRTSPWPYPTSSA